MINRVTNRIFSVLSSELVVGQTISVERVMEINKDLRLPRTFKKALIYYRILYPVRRDTYKIQREVTLPLADKIRQYINEQNPNSNARNPYKYLPQIGRFFK